MLGCTAGESASFCRVLGLQQKNAGFCNLLSCLKTEHAPTRVSLPISLFLHGIQLLLQLLYSAYHSHHHFKLLCILFLKRLQRKQEYDSMALTPSSDWRDRTAAVHHANTRKQCYRRGMQQCYAKDAGRMQPAPTVAVASSYQTSSKSSLYTTLALATPRAVGHTAKHLSVI